MNLRRLGQCVVALGLLAGMSSRADAQGVYHNQRLFIVPAPGKIVIDGDLKDWDLSGTIYTYVIEATAAFQSARTAMMYDAEALYISARVADPTPMLNKADPDVNPDFGWDGDAFQFRLCLDPGLGYPLKIGGYDRTPNEMLVHMTLWYHTDSRKPVLHLKYGMDFHDAHGYHKGVVPADKFQAVYVRWPDGKGYTFEYRIPWTTLGAPRPFKPGEMSAAAMQMQWSDQTGHHSYGGGWAVDLMSHAGFTYQSTGSWGKAIFAEKGNLPKELTREGLAPVRSMPLRFSFDLPRELVTSITLIDAKGDRVRNLIAAQSRPGGRVTESWDGLDNVGRVLPAGEYTWKGLYHEPLKTRYALAVGNSGVPSYNTPDGKNDLYWQRLSPKQILPNGVPLFDDASLKQVDYAKDPSCYTYDLAVDPADGSVLMYAGTDIKHLDRTEIWPINAWSRDGKLLWRYRLGCRWHDMYEFPIPKPGELYGCTRNLGITDGITGFSCYFGQAQLMTTDGVAIGTIMQDGRSGETGPDQIQCEWFTGQLVKLKDGRWFLLGGDQDGRVLEVLGLNTLRRFEGRLTITPEEARQAAAALADWSAEKAKAQSLVLGRCTGSPDWDNLRAVKIDVDQRRGFTVQAAYNATDLVLRYDVRSPFELVNSTPEQNMLFKGGNLLDIQLATDPAADPKRQKPAAGDLRVLVTRRDGKPLAVIYRPKQAGSQGQPTVFTSPTGQESIDRIEFWDNVKLQYAKTENGFQTVVCLPLARLGLTLKPGTVQRMDVGYIFGNPTGNTTALRAYWSNKSFTAGVTQDVPHEARLEPAQWGNATVE